ncbi:MULTISPECIES: AAA family ATPase [Bradyrhizobium]|mgnify:CR=1 FL=1|jgi:predicted ATPase|uniref:AAA family ATPase n=1 Tax=Bradyrhizobium TaxID=374 RepID=UPI0003FB4CFF|nr:MULTISPECIES: AAA family ATPase [Bradyrhizobium]KIU47274.1 ATPase [Bradyrhizobium elkanii]OCX31667.1 ATPase [Bradyrhizobium sp. UASWS1016]
MRPTDIEIANYRSIRRLFLPIHPLSVFVGENGVGKSNLYKSMSLLRDAAAGRITHTIADEGGLNSVSWSGMRKRGDDPRLRLAARFDDIRYSIELGYPGPVEAAFAGEPMIRSERIEMISGKRNVLMVERTNALVSIRNESGVWESHKDALLPSETVLAGFFDGKNSPEIDQIRNAMLGWRFYHDFRTDQASPIRKPCLAVTTPSLSADGSDLAATLATLYAIRQDAAELQAAIEDAFPDAELRAWVENGRCEFDLQLADMPRPFKAHELSDGTLKYICLLAVFMGYRLPPFIVLNEPEASLHPSLLAPLARLIAKASRRADIWIVTHSDHLMEALRSESSVPLRRVVKVKGATAIEGLSIGGEFRDVEAEGDESEDDDD